MRNRFVHAFVIKTQETLAVLPLTAKYRIELSGESAEHVQISVHTADGQLAGNRTDEERPVDSITVAFGRNGGGKTQLLLNICNTIARQRGTHGNRGSVPTFQHGLNLRRST
jgi:ABC-type Mn2+/Zn2+ transport system ATPase subunit